MLLPLMLTHQLIVVSETIIDFIAILGRDNLSVLLLELLLILSDDLRVYLFETCQILILRPVNLLLASTRNLVADRLEALDVGHRTLLLCLFLNVI